VNPLGIIPNAILLIFLLLVTRRLRAGRHLVRRLMRAE